MELGIYVHIPFCLSKCYYCDFASYAQDQSHYQAYVEALIKEIRAQGESTQQALTIKTIFIGGGTPSVLPPILLGKILKALSETFHIARDAEYTIESNPGTLSLEKLKVMKGYGINRISMGAQACQNHLLKKIGRTHTVEDIKESYALCKKAGFNNINLDLMFGLPTQTLEDWKESLEEVVKLGPEHISAYSLIIEDGTPFGKMYDEGLLKEFDENIERSMYYYTRDYLRQAGYDQYEISNYAKAGKESRHNVNNWKTYPYIGTGLGAHSYYKGNRYHNTYDMNEYLENSSDLKKIQKDKEALDQKAQMEEYMFLGLRLSQGIEIEDFHKRFNRSIYDVYASQIKQHEKDKLLRQEDGRIYLTNYGQDLSNRVMSSFLID